MAEKKNIEHEISEEIQSIVERIPGSFGYAVSSIVIGLVVLLIIFGWMVKYPDVVSGRITISSNNTPVKLIANTSGNLQLCGYNSQDIVKNGEYIAIVSNSAKLVDIQRVRKILTNFRINNITLDYELPRNVSLGEIDAKYFAFLNAYDDLANYNAGNLLTKEEQRVSQSIIEQTNAMKVTSGQLDMSLANLKLVKKFSARDSILFSKKVLTESEMDKSQMNEISANIAYHNSLNNKITISEQLDESANKIEQLTIQKKEKKRVLILSVMSSFTDLSDAFKLWEQKFAFKAPITGKVQFLKFFTKEHFIQAGDGIFTIIPPESKIIGQMLVPALGAGKVKIGQEIIMKLDNYPFTEYGSVVGKVATISLTTNTIKVEGGESEAYLVNVNLPNALKTNNGSKLGFKFEIKGSGEIITNDRRLYQRFFDNLKLMINK